MLVDLQGEQASRNPHCYLADPLLALKSPEQEGLLHLGASLGVPRHGGRVDVLMGELLGWSAHVFISAPSSHPTKVAEKAGEPRSVSQGQKGQEKKHQKRRIDEVNTGQLDNWYLT